MHYTARIEVPLTPLEFMRRARRLYSTREAVVDGTLRYTYGQFFDRCERWAAHLRAIGVRQGNRVVYIAPNTHAQLEAFYAVPMLGAVLVPVNYRLAPDDFRYLIDHSGASVVCAHSDFLETVDSVRSDLLRVRRFFALEGSRAGWEDYEAAVGVGGALTGRPVIEEGDLLTINYTSGCEPRPEHPDLSPDARAAIKARQGVELVTSGEVRVVTGEGAEVPHDGETMGEIVARGNVVMAGYFNDPDATANAIRDGWFHSGDAAVVHPDGYVEIRDRFKDVIKSGGENISSVELGQDLHDGVPTGRVQVAGGLVGQHDRDVAQGDGRLLSVTVEDPADALQPDQRHLGARRSVRRDSRAAFPP